MCTTTHRSNEGLGLRRSAGRRSRTAALLVAALLAGCGGGAASADDCLLTEEEVAQLTGVEVQELELITQPDGEWLLCSFDGEANGRLHSTNVRIYLDNERGATIFDRVAEEGELLDPAEEGERIAANRATATVMVETVDGTYLEASVRAPGLRDVQVGAVSRIASAMLSRYRES